MICVDSAFLSENADFGYYTNSYEVACYVTVANRKVLVLTFHVPPANS